MSQPVGLLESEEGEKRQAMGTFLEKVLPIE